MLRCADVKDFGCLRLVLRSSVKIDTCSLFTSGDGVRGRSLSFDILFS